MGLNMDGGRTTAQSAAEATGLKAREGDGGGEGVQADTKQ